MGFPENIKLQSNTQPYAMDRAKCPRYRDVRTFYSTKTVEVSGFIKRRLPALVER